MADSFKGQSVIRIAGHVGMQADMVLVIDSLVGNMKLTDTEWYPDHRKPQSPSPQ